jgi:membrane protease YdiL (CAAX protease family)
MADYASAVVEIASEGARPEVPLDETRQRWFELSLVLLVAFGGSLVNALYFLQHGPSAVLGASTLRWSYALVHEISALLLLGYVLSRRRLRFKELGLRWSMRDVGLGLLVAAGSFAAYVLGSLFIELCHHWIYGSWATVRSGADFFAPPSMAFIPFVFVNPFFEELIVRAYLMTEVFDLTRSSKLSVAASVLVQSSYHLYYGWTGAISLSFPFLVFALYYIRSRRALPVIIAHGFFDLYALLRLW